VNDFGDSLLKLSTTSGLKRADFFTPSDQANVDSLDLDFGSGAAVVLVDLPQGAAFQHLVIGGGKGSGFLGELYVLNRDSLGGYKQGSGGVDKVFRSFNQPSHLATPAFWQNRMYLAGFSGPLQAYTLNTTTSTFNTSPASQSSATFRRATPSIPLPAPRTELSGLSTQPAMELRTAEVELHFRQFFALSSQQPERRTLEQHQSFWGRGRKCRQIHRADRGERKSLCPHARQ